MSTSEEGVVVSLLQLPVPLWTKSDEEGKDLMREFALIALSDHGATTVPSRLLEVVHELQDSYGTLGEAQERELEQARLAGENVIERLEYVLPPGIAPTLERLSAIMDEADEYCRQGEHLLSLAASPPVKALRDWVFTEVRIQLEGGSPTPWPESEFAARAGEGVRE